MPNSSPNRTATTREGRNMPADAMLSVAAVLAGDRTFGRRADGSPITREARCECGRAFTQLQLSEQFLEIVERHSPRAIALLRQQLPDFFVPKFCPRCERKDLGRQARIDQQRFETRGDELRTEDRTGDRTGDRDAAD